MPACAAWQKHSYSIHCAAMLASSANTCQRHLVHSAAGLPHKDQVGRRAVRLCLPSRLGAGICGSEWTLLDSRQARSGFSYIVTALWKHRPALVLLALICEHSLVQVSGHGRCSSLVRLLC